jgi:hypothetical protein
MVISAETAFKSDYEILRQFLTSVGFGPQDALETNSELI